jgi:hypothetical protein
LPKQFTAASDRIRGTGEERRIRADAANLLLAGPTRGQHESREGAAMTHEELAQAIHVVLETAGHEGVSLETQTEVMEQLTEAMRDSLS